MKRRPIIIDTDPGVDDFFCLMMAQAHSDIFDIRGLTTICGNHRTDTTTRNALDIAKLLGMNTKISRGADNYLMEPYGPNTSPVHGGNGLGGLTLPESHQPVQKEYAWDFIYKEALACNGELELVPVGPLTNIAIALIKYPQLRTMVKGITLMGGSTFAGNLLPYSEANITHDVIAADIVFRSGIPITMVGLNVTKPCAIYVSDFEDKLTHIPQDLADAVVKLTQFYTGRAFHDAIVIAAMVDPELIQFRDYYVSIETRSLLTKGQTIVDFNGMTRKKPNTSVAVSISMDRYREMFREMLDAYRV